VLAVEIHQLPFPHRCEMVIKSDQNSVLSFSNQSPDNMSKTELVTREGYEALQQELNHLWREKRPDTTAKVAWAASLGDRSENADWKLELPFLY
jgi:hypothetical protein